MRIGEPMRALGPRLCPAPWPPARDPTTHQSHPPAAPWVPEAPGPALRSGTTTRKIHQLTVNAEMQRQETASLESRGPWGSGPQALLLSQPFPARYLGERRKRTPAITSHSEIQR